jgi:DNA-3-methyladenine glycosylase
LRRFSPLPLSFYRRPTTEVARDLLGRYVVCNDETCRLVLRLVEVEAYLGAADRASHAYGGRRSRANASLYLPAGHAYVYFIYGMHFCLNAVTGDRIEGGAVLLRAGEPVSGEERMRARRGLPETVRPGDIAGGPGKLCQALGVDRRFDGVALSRGALRLTHGEPVAGASIGIGSRIGVAYAGEAAGWPLRFAVRGHPHVSRPRLGGGAPGAGADTPG